jgi:hypothetical protein
MVDLTQKFHHNHSLFAGLSSHHGSHYSSGDGPALQSVQSQAAAQRRRRGGGRGAAARAAGPSEKVMKARSCKIEGQLNNEK